MNTLEISDLRAKLHKSKSRPACANCGEHPATDIHHLDGHHHNNEPANLSPWCKLCHDKVHGITARLNDLALVVRQFYALQDMRKAMGSRIAAYQRLGYYANHAGDIFDETAKLENYIGRIITDLVEFEPIYQAWLKHVKGIGPILAAAIVSRILSIDRFEYISALWAFSGLDVGADGRARKRRKGEKANWNADLRMLIAYKVPSQFIKATTSFGRKLYDQYKRFYEQTHDAKCPVWSDPNKMVNKSGTKATVNSEGCSRKGHIHNMATRKVGKVFLSCLWLAWRELDGLPITQPYATKLPGHNHIIQPKDWIQ